MRIKSQDQFKSQDSNVGQNFCKSQWLTISFGRASESICYRFGRFGNVVSGIQTVCTYHRQKAFLPGQWKDLYIQYITYIIMHAYVCMYCTITIQIIIPRCRL